MNIWRIHELLCMLGIGRNYLGHNIIMEAIRLILCDKNRLLHVKDEILRPIAMQHQCDWRTTERNIRTVIHRAWKLNRPLVECMARYPLDQEPTVTEFLDMLTEYVTRPRGNMQS